ncbi:hypothetical protein BT69DRAFT_1288651, partial [Atractiella rhizophila]
MPAFLLHISKPPWSTNQAQALAHMARGISTAQVRALSSQPEHKSSCTRHPQALINGIVEA